MEYTSIFEKIENLKIILACLIKGSIRIEPTYN